MEKRKNLNQKKHRINSIHKNKPRFAHLLYMTLKRVILFPSFYFVFFSLTMGLSLIVSPLYSNSLYQYEDFSAVPATGWSNATAGTNDTWNNTNRGVTYSREGSYATDGSTDIVFRIDNGGNGRLTFTGATGTITTEGGDNGEIQAYDWSVWSGKMAVYHGTSYSASANQPFGIQIIKEETRLDPNDDNSNDESHRHQNAFMFYIYQPEAGVFNNANIPPRPFTNIVGMYEKYYAQRPVLGSPVSEWGYYISAESNFNLAAGTRPDGTLNYDLSGAPLQWNYDDYYSTSTVNGSAGLDDSGNFTDAVHNPNSANQNPVGIRIVHNGSTLYFYANPNPVDGDGKYEALPNEYIQVGQVGATFTDSMNYMLGVETPRRDTEMHWVELDNLLIRSVADGDAADTMVEMNPTKAKVGSATAFKMLISPTINTNDAGIAEVKITKPSTFTDTWDTANINVYTTHGAGAAFNDGTASYTNLKKLTLDNRGATCTFSQSADGSVAVCSSGSDLILRFRSVSAADNDVIKSGDAEKRIAVEFSLDAPGTADLTGEEFLVYLNNEKYDSSHTDNTTGNNGLRYASTSWQNVLAGNAGANWVNNTMTVKTMDVPSGYASVTPSAMYVGVPLDLQTFIQAPSDANNSNIDKIFYEVREYNYTLNGSTCTLENLALTNTNCSWTLGGVVDIRDTSGGNSKGFGLTGTGFATSQVESNICTVGSCSVDATGAVVQFSTADNGITGNGGLDKIILDITETPLKKLDGTDIIQPQYYKLTATVYNTEVDSSNGTTATTGSFGTYDQYFQLKPAKPNAIVKIAPDSACNGTEGRLCNNMNQSVTMTVTNLGNAGNNLRRLQINLTDDDFDENQITALSNVSVTVKNSAISGGSEFSFNTSTDASHFSLKTTNADCGSIPDVNKCYVIQFSGVSGQAGNNALGLLGGDNNIAQIKFTIEDDIDSLSADKALTFNGYVDNGNGDALTDNAYTRDSSGLIALTYTAPNPRAKSEIVRHSSFSYDNAGAGCSSDYVPNPSNTRQLYVTTCQNNVKFSYYIYNPSTIEDPTNIDNVVKEVKVTIPGTFTNIDNLQSLKGGTISEAGNVITVTYGVGNYIQPGENDEIIFTADEGNTSKASIALSSTVSNQGDGSNAQNTSDKISGSNEVAFVNQPLKAVGYAKVIHKPDALADADDNESDPLKLDINVAWDNSSKENTIRYYLKNLGLPGTKIQKVRIYLRDGNEAAWDTAGAGALASGAGGIAGDASHAFTAATGTISGTSAGISCTSDATYSRSDAGGAKYIDCDFTGHTSGGIDPSATDDTYIQFKMGHYQAIAGGTPIGLRARALNELGVENSNTYYPSNTEATYAHIEAATTSQWAASTQSVEMQIARPQAYISGYLVRSFALVQSSAVNHNLQYIIKNEGLGNNDIYTAQIGIPSELNGKISSPSASSGATASVGACHANVTSDNADYTQCIIIDYAGNLASAATDTISFTLSNDITTEKDYTFQVYAENDSDAGEPVVYDSGTLGNAQKTRHLYIVLKPKVQLTSTEDKNSSTPGNPVQLHNINQTPTVTYRIQNENTSGTGREIRQAKILVPNSFCIEDGTIQVTSSIIGAVATPASCGDPIVLDYAGSASSIAAGSLDDITFEFKKAAVPADFDIASYDWNMRVYYNDGSTDALSDSDYDKDSPTGGDWVDASTNVFSGTSIATEFVRPPITGVAYIANNTTLFDNKYNHLGVDFPSWGNLSDTSIDDGAFSVYVQNTSSIAANNVRYVKITAPATLIASIEDDSNVVVVKDPEGTPTPLTGSGTHYSVVDNAIDNNTLVLQFNNGVFAPNDLMKISFQMTRVGVLPGTLNALFAVTISNDVSGVTNNVNAVSPVAESSSNTNRALTLYYYNPGTASEFYVEKGDVNAGENGDMNMLYNTENSHKANVTVRNTGHEGSLVEKVKITVPVNVFTSTSSKLELVGHNAGGTDYIYKNAASCPDSTNNQKFFHCISGCTDAAGNVQVNTTAQVVEVELCRDSVNAADDARIRTSGNDNDYVVFKFTDLGTGTSAASADLYPSTPGAGDQFTVDVMYNTRYTSGPYSASLLSGKSDYISMKRPTPSGSAYVYSSDIQLKTTGGVNLNSFDKNKDHSVPSNHILYALDNDGWPVSEDGKRKIRLIIKNDGSAQNDIRGVKIKIPQSASTTGGVLELSGTSEADLYVKDNHCLDSSSAFPGSCGAGEPKTTATGLISSANATMTAADDAEGNKIITIKYNNDQFLGGQDLMLSIPVNYSLLNLPAETQSYLVMITNSDSIATSTSDNLMYTDGDPNVVTLSAPAGQSLIHDFVYPSAVMYTDITSGASLYHLTKESGSATINHTIKYRIRPKGTPTKAIAVKIPYKLFGANPNVVSVASQLAPGLGGSVIDTYKDSHNGIWVIDYGAGLNPGSVETLTITLDGTLTESDAGTLNMEARYYNVVAPPEFANCDENLEMVNDLNSNGNACYEAIFTAESGETQIFRIARAPYGYIKGMINPLKNPKDENLEVSVSILDASGNALSDYGSAPISVTTSAGVGEFEFSGTWADDNTVSGISAGVIPVCSDYSDEATCTATRDIILSFTAPKYSALRVPVTIQRGKKLDLGTLGPMKEAPFTVGGDEDNIAVARDGSSICARVTIPPDGINETFTVRASCMNVTSLRASSESKKSILESMLASGKENIQGAASIGDAPIYIMNIFDSSGTTLENVDLFHRENDKGINETSIEATLELNYTEADITANGWSEGNLAVFSFDPYRNYWVKLGGKVDADNNKITVGIATLNRYYGVFGANSESGAIANVVVSPRVFTPGRGSRYFNRMALQFSLDKSYDKYEVMIFDMSGKKVAEFEKSGAYQSGQIFWDGYDTRGNLVHGGLYMYVIRAGEEKYRGTIVVVR